MILKVYPTARSIREEYISYNNDTLLPKIVTIDEFEKKAILLNREIVDEDSRIFYLREATKFENFKKLRFDTEFFSFLKNSEYLLRFFEELAKENVDIETLKEYDTYATYEEDITHLEELLNNYKTILDKYNKTDKIFYVNDYRINEDYINSFEKIEMILEGYLSKFEFNLFNEIAKLTNFHIHLKINQFNSKVAEQFREIDIDLIPNYHYQIDLSNRKIVNQREIESNLKNVEINSFENRLLQIANIKRKIYEYIKKGIEPEKIVVVTPDENFVEILKSYDSENYLNFAIGFSFKNSKLYRQLEAIESYLEERSFENRYRLERLNIDIEKINNFHKNWSKRVDSKLFLELLYSLLKEIEIEEFEIIEEELFLFRTFLNNMESLIFQRVYHLFLSRLAKRRVDDTRGGRIKVIGVLESRAISFDAVILIDFNENIVPKKSKKDLFLSSDLRAKVKLPTLKDRENLQKYYYHSLIFNAKEVSISFISNDENMPSRFIEELGLTKYREIEQSKILEILYKNHTEKPHFHLEDLYLTFDFKKVYISPTMLKTFLECKRKFYFLYIKRLEFEEVPKEDTLNTKEIGVLLHEALAKLYKKRAFYDKSDELFRKIKENLYEKAENNIYLKYQIDVWLNRLFTFSKSEVERFNKGYRILEVEKEYLIEYKGFILKSRIDRIDIKDDLIEIIDYKSGKIPLTPKDLTKITDFQLEFYYHLLKDRYRINQIYYYDLNSVELKEWEKSNERLKRFDEVLEELNQTEFNFKQCEEINRCRYCDYNIICGR